MKHQLNSILAIASTVLCVTALCAQDYVCLPKQARQTQFIWEQANVPFLGKPQSELDSLFRVVSHRQQAIVLALSHRLDALPGRWASLDSINSGRQWNVHSSCRYLNPGEQRFILPASAVPSEWESAEWELIVNGDAFPIVLDEPIAVFISETADAATVGLRLHTGMTAVEHHLLLPVLGNSNCPQPDPPPWPTQNPEDPFWVGVFHEGIPVTGQALIRLGSDGIFNKPLILLEGFDPDLNGHFPSYGYGDMNWDVIWNCDGAYSDALEGLSTVLDSVLLEGFDLVFLDFENGTRSIFEQAALVQHVIEQCRDYRIGNEPMVVVGPSMGGVVARHTLRTMELLDMDHCVRSFVAIDTPFRGAYLPLALQEAISFFADISVDAHLLSMALSSPAAGELLVGSPFHPPQTRAALEASQEELGLPQRCRNLSVVNSNPAVPNAPPEVWYAASEGFWGWEYLNILLHSQPGVANHPASEPDASVIFEGELFNPNWEWGDPLFLESVALASNDLPLYEQLAGSTSAHLAKLHDALELAGIESSAFSPTSMFVPAHSALDLPLFDAFTPANIPFDDWSTESIAIGSAAHCEVSNHVEFIWEHIVEAQPAQFSESGSDSNTLMVGWSQPQQWLLLGTTDATTQANYQLGTTESNGAGTWPVFECATSPCASELVVAEGRTMQIGDALGTGSAQASFSLSPHTTLRVRGDVYIGAHSTLRLDPGATLILEGGTLHIDPFGRIDQQPNSRVETLGRGEILLSGASSTWDLAGVLHIGDHDTLLVTAPANEPVGQIRLLHNQGYTYIGSQGQLRLASSAFFPFNVHFEAGSGHLFEGAGSFWMRGAHVHVQDACEWIMKCRTSFDDVHIAGISPEHTIEIHNRFNWQEGSAEYVKIRARNGGVAGVILGNIHSENAQFQLDSTGVRMQGCSFVNSAIVCTDLDELSSIQSSEFFGGLDGEAQLQILHSAQAVRIEGNTFSGHSCGLHLNDASAQIACNAWTDSDIGIRLDTNAILDGSASWGRNSWADNGIHIACNHTYLPDFNDGFNAFGASADAVLLGTVNYPLSATDGPTGVHLVGWNQNMWPNASLGVPTLVPYTGLESTLDGGEIQIKDASPNHTACANSAPTPEMDTPKRGTIHGNPSESLATWSVYPNPADHAFHIVHPLQDSGEILEVIVFDASGRRIYAKQHEPNGESALTVATKSFEPGWYTLDVRCNGQSAFKSQLLIQH